MKLEDPETAPNNQPQRKGEPMKWRNLAAAAALLSAMNAIPSASAASLEMSNGDYLTIFLFGTTAEPFVIDQTGDTNVANVIELGGSGPLDSTIVQTGTTNNANVFQAGGTTSSLIGQSGMTNAADVMQHDNSMNPFVAPFANMNTGPVSQFGDASGLGTLKPRGG